MFRLRWRSRATAHKERPARPPHHRRGQQPLHPGRHAGAAQRLAPSEVAGHGQHEHRHGECQADRNGGSVAQLPGLPAAVRRCAQHRLQRHAANGADAGPIGAPSGAWDRCIRWRRAGAGGGGAWLRRQARGRMRAVASPAYRRGSALHRCARHAEHAHGALHVACLPCAPRSDRSPMTMPPAMGALAGTGCSVMPQRAAARLALAHLRVLGAGEGVAGAVGRVGGGRGGHGRAWAMQALA